MTERQHRLLITGSRSWSNTALIFTTLDALVQASEVPYSRWTLVSGACPKGADRICEDWAASRFIAVERHPAQWEEFGRNAGVRRNREMVRLGADICVAFIDACRDDHCRMTEVHGTHGSVHCASEARKRGIPVHVVPEPRSPALAEPLTWLNPVRATVVPRGEVAQVPEATG